MKPQERAYGSLQVQEILQVGGICRLGWIFPWTKSGDPWQTVPGVMNLGIAEKRFGEMIIVMPDEKTKWGGSFYTNSTVT